MQMPDEILRAFNVAHKPVQQTKPSTPRVHRLSTVHKVGPEIRVEAKPQSRGGHAPRVATSGSYLACESARTYGVKSRI